MEARAFAFPFRGGARYARRIYTARRPSARSTSASPPPPTPPGRRSPPSVRAPRGLRPPHRAPALDPRTDADRRPRSTDRPCPRRVPARPSGTSTGPAGGECPVGARTITTRRGAFSQIRGGGPRPARRPVTAGRARGPWAVGAPARPVGRAGRDRPPDPGADLPGRKRHRTARALRERGAATRQFAGRPYRSACAWRISGDLGPGGRGLDPDHAGRGRARRRRPDRRARAGPRRHPRAPGRRRLAGHPGGPGPRVGDPPLAGPADRRGDPAPAGQGPARARLATAGPVAAPRSRAPRRQRAPLGWASKPCARGEFGEIRRRRPRRPHGLRGGRDRAPAVEPPGVRPLLAGRAADPAGPGRGPFGGPAGARRGSGGVGAPARTPALRHRSCPWRQAGCYTARS